MLDNPLTFYDKDGNIIDHFTQWDTDQTIYADKWTTFIREPVFYFNNKNSKSAYSVTSKFVDDKVSVNIPNELFKEAETIIIRTYVYSSSTSAKTEYITRIPVLRALIPDEYEYASNYKEISVSDLLRRVEILEAKVKTLQSRIDELSQTQ